MNLRHITSAALLSLFTLHTSLFCHAQAVAQQSEDYQTAAATNGVNLQSDLGNTTPPAVPVVTTPAAATSGTNDEIVQMSVFSVQGTRDVGYQSFDTTSGSRLRTELRNTAASVSPFTEEFLNDIGATTVEDLITFAGNAEADVADNLTGMNDASSRFAANTSNSLRIRGMTASTFVDYAEYNAPIDNYNLGRSEISSGPNAILFGMGSQGGILNWTRATANAQRNKLTVQAGFGTWTSPAVSGIPWQRYTLDYNLVLKPRVLGFRLMGLYQDGGNSSWRYWQMLRDRRLSPAVYIHPFKNTTINLTYEQGRQQSSTSRPLNAADGLSGWLANVDPDTGKPRTIDTFGYTANTNDQSIPYTIVNMQNPNQNNYTYVNNTNQLFNLRQAYQSTNIWSSAFSVFNANNYNQIRLPNDMSSYYYNSVGPAGRRDQKFENWSASIEQSIGKFNFSLGWYHSKTSNTALAGDNNNVILYGDPNAYLSPPNWTGVAISNPNVGQMYMENSWNTSTQTAKNDTVHLITNYDFNLGKWGRHRLVNLLEHTNNETTSDQKVQILVDTDNQAIFDSVNPNNAQNVITWRHYVTPGDFRTYYDGDPRTPINDLTIGDRTFHSAWIDKNQLASHIKRTTDSVMLALTSYWFNESVSTIIGGRVDNVVFKREQLPQRITDRNDPRVLDGERVLNEYALTGKWLPENTYNPFTLSAGGVWHMPWLGKRISPFINYSTNRGLPSVDNSTTFPSGNLAPLTKGQTLDYGVMIDIMGDSKYSLRLTRYQTKQLGDPVAPLANTAINSNIGSTNVFNIFDALYLLTPTGQTGDNSNLNGVWPAGTGPGKGPMKASDYAVLNGLPPMVNSGLTDVRSEGYELEFTANPTKNLTIRFMASYTKRQRQNLFPEVFNYINTNLPQWLKLADPNRNGGYDANGPQYDLNGLPHGTPAFAVVTPVASTIILPTGVAISTATPTLYDYMLTQLYSTYNVLGPTYGNITSNASSMRTGIDGLLNSNSNMNGNRPYKFNATVRYSFPSSFGILKGAFIGGSSRFQSFAYIPDPTRTARQYSTPVDLPMNANDPIPENLGLDQNLYNDSSLMLKSNSFIFWDIFAGYKCKILGGRSTMRIQLNIKNIFNKYVIADGRLALIGNDLLPVRMYLNPPRSYRLTVSFDF